MERRVISRFRDFDQGGAWVVEEPYDVAFEDVGWLLGFTKPPETIDGVVPDGRLLQVGAHIGNEYGKHCQ